MVVLLFAGRFALTVQLFQSRFSQDLFQVDSQLWLGSAVVARKSYAALATRVYPLLGCAVLPATVVGGSNRSKTWSGGSTPTAPLPCKSRGSSGLAYWALQLEVAKGDSTERSHLFGLMHDVCSKEY